MDRMGAADKAAADLGLGERRAVYGRAVRIVVMSAVMAVAAVGFAVLGTWILLKRDAAVGAGIMWTFTFFALLAIVPFLRMAKRRLHIFEHGLVVVSAKAQATGFRFDAVSVKQAITRSTYNGIRMPTTYVYTLTRSDGVTKRIDSNFAGVTAWGPGIQDLVTRIQLPRALAELEARGTLTFGPLTIDRTGISTAKKHVPWSQIQSFSLRNGSFGVNAGGRWLPVASTPVAKIPDFFVFIALAERVRTGS